MSLLEIAGIITKVFVSIASGFIFIYLLNTIFVPLLQAWFQTQVERAHSVQIHHKANFRAYYYIAVEPLQPGFKFQLKAGEIPLAELPQTTEPDQPQPSPTTEAKSTKTQQPAKAADQNKNDKSAQISQQAIDAGNKAMVKVGILANMFGALANILSLVPGVGVFFRQNQENLRQGQEKIFHAAQAPKMTKQSLEALQADTYRLGGVQPVKNTPDKNTAQSTTVQPGSASFTLKQAEPVKFTGAIAEASSSSSSRPYNGLYCVKTAELEPEQTISLKLIASPVSGKYQAGSFSYILHAQVMPTDPIEEKIKEISRHGLIHYKPIHLAQTALPALVYSLLGLTFALAYLFILSITWLIGL